MSATRKQFHEYLTANPQHEMIEHPNPSALGLRKFVRKTAKAWIFQDVIGREWELPIAADIELTDSGFVVPMGRHQIVYKRIPA